MINESDQSADANERSGYRKTVTTTRYCQPTSEFRCISDVGPSVRKPSRARKFCRTITESVFVIALLIVNGVRADTNGVMRIASPDEKTAVTISLSSDGKGVSYSVARKGEVVLSPSALGVVLTKATRSGPLVITSVERKSVDTHYTVVVGKTRVARDHYNEIKISVQEQLESKPRVDIVFRAYDDGIAFRYVIPDQRGMEQVSVSREKTQFNFAGDYQCWGFNSGTTENTHEGEYDPILASRIRSHYLYDLPLVCRTTSGATSFAIAEADLQDYGALYLRGRVDGAPGVSAQLAMRHDLPGIGAMVRMTSAGVRSPWRVVMMADRLGQLIPSNLVTNLSSPSLIKDTSWIKPGKAAWYWFSADLTGVGIRAGMNMPTLQHYIDFAGRNGFEYALIDIGWSFGSDINGGNFSAFGDSLVQEKPQQSDLTRTENRLDMPGLVQHARKQNVGLFVWVHWKAIDGQLEAAFSQFERWGLKGVKVDFMDRADQQIVDFCHRVLRKAAEHKLLIEFHGSYHPTGLNRTWPNLLTQEGVLGSEWNVFSRRVTATHNVTIPYTRMLLGPMDYTPGIFNNVTPGQFFPTDVNTKAMYTRGQTLAMYVVYDSPLQMLADQPAAYEGASGFEFIKEVPTSWDETIFIEGEIGESVALARRKGREWYVGAMTNEQSRTVDVPLRFLGEGKFSAVLWVDGEEPTALSRSQLKGLTSHESLALRLAPSGGAAVRFSPEGL